MRILFVDDDDDLRQLFTLVLDNAAPELQIDEAISGADAVSKLKKNPPYDLIISDYVMPNGNGGVVYNYVKENSPEIPFILLTTEEIDRHEEFFSFFEDHPANVYVKKPISPKNFKEVVFSVFENISDDYEAKKIQSRLMDNYCRIRSIFFLKFDRTLCDVFVRLSDDKYVKVFKKDTAFSSFDIRKYVNRGVDFLYITKEDYERFEVSFSQTPFLTKISKAHDVQEEQEIWERNNEVIQYLVSTYGISKTVVNISSQMVDTVAKQIKTSSELLKLFNKKKEGLSFIYEHSYLVSVIATAIASKLEWGGPQAYEKLCYASIFHDVVIDDPLIASIEGRHDKKIELLDDRQKKIFLEHSKAAAELVKQSGLFQTTDVETIILQHHETPEGNGFPRGLPANRIFPMACVFIVAHDFVRELYEVNFDPDFRIPIIKKFKAKYDKGNFQGIVDAFILSLGLDPNEIQAFRRQIVSV